MEQTLGKRIAHHRKQQGLTQDQLAEKLGITAQAVSKWENDLSCPDITMLPKLAEIFGTTTDELLGRESSEPVHTAEVVEDEEDSGIHFDNGRGSSWSFHWDSGRRHAVLSALFVLWVGGLMLLTRALNWDISFWSIAWPSAFLIFGLGKLFSHFSLFYLGGALFGAYFLASNMNLMVWDISRELIFPICVVLFGAGLLFEAMHKPKKPRFKVTKRGGNSKKTDYHCESTGNSFHCDLSFGEKTYLVNTPSLASGEANLSFGTLIIDLSGVEAVEPDCTIEANCSFGEIIFLVPSKFAVESDDCTAFGDVHMQGQACANPDAVIHLDANVSFGSIHVRYK